MFYPNELLKRRGKFGLIWLAAMRAKKLNRRQICSVDVVVSSEDVIAVICQHTLSGIEKRIYFSLSLSSQLMNGLANILDNQSKILLDDLKCTISKFGDTKVSIDLERPLNKLRVTLEELDFTNVPFEFGHLGPLPEPSHHDYLREYPFIITPRVSDEEMSPEMQDRERTRHEDLLDGIELLHTSRQEDITLLDESPFFIDEPIIQIEEAVDFLAPPFSFLSQPPVLPESMPLHPVDVDIGPLQPDIEMPIFITPEAPTEEPILQPHVPDFQTPLSIGMVGDSPIQHEDQVSDVSLSEGFVLPPVVHPTKRRKRRHLIIDKVTAIPAKQMKKNILSNIDHLTVPLVIPSYLESADSLMSRLGAGLVPKGMRNRFKRLKILPRPNEAIGHFMPEEIPEDMEEGGPHGIRFSTSEPVEQQRAADTIDDTRDHLRSGLLKSTSIKSFEASTNLSTKTKDVGMPSPLRFMNEEEIQLLNIEHVSEAALLEPLPELEVPQPDMGYGEVQEQTNGIPVGDRQVLSPKSPERTPPPSTPTPLSEILNEAFELIKETATFSVIPNMTTFSAVLERINATKRRVASLFNSLLILHTNGKIRVQQPLPFKEIFIQIMEIDTPEV